jgi:arsenite methyltransferase
MGRVPDRHAAEVAMTNPTVPQPHVGQHRATYGIDAPYVPLLLGIGGLATLGVTALNVLRHAGPLPVVWCALVSLVMLGSTASYLYTTRAGKFAVWARLLKELHLRGDERVLDMGCGRGAVLLAAAQRVPRGQAIGVDLWKTADQSGNSMDVTRRNAALEGVADRVELHTADMRDLPFADGSFDVVVSSLAIHNIPDAAGRAKAIAEAVRVLRPGGQLLIADIRAAGEYRDTLRQVGLADVGTRPLGWRFWYGGPWMATTLVSATKQT